MKNISILGSTGSIGTQALDVIRSNTSFNVTALSGNNNIDLLEKQALEFRPDFIAVANPEKALILSERLRTENIEVLSGMEGLIAVATEPSTDIVITSVVGMIGLVPTLEGIKSGKTIALANKETLVTAGELVMKSAKRHNVNILPVDSEHSAIFQCLQGEKISEVSKLILTASGGPFRGKKTSDLEHVEPEEALKHPTWSMGKKISIDSATLMNKGLEVIEARWLFDFNINNIEVVVHPQSIIHSMVEFQDGSVLSHMGISDMRVPIQYALSYPKRFKMNLPRLNLVQQGKLTFEHPDMVVFPCLRLAIDACKEGGTMPTVLNAANEVAVQLFLDKYINFNDIPRIIEKVMDNHINISNPTLESIIEIDHQTRSRILKSYNV